MICDGEKSEGRGLFAKNVVCEVGKGRGENWQEKSFDGGCLGVQWKCSMLECVLDSRVFGGNVVEITNQNQFVVEAQ
jgi:hypothetical protein